MLCLLCSHYTRALPNNNAFHLYAFAVLLLFRSNGRFELGFIFLLQFTLHFAREFFRSLFNGFLRTFGWYGDLQRRERLTYGTFNGLPDVFL